MKKVFVTLMTFAMILGSANLVAQDKEKKCYKAKTEACMDKEKKESTEEAEKKECSKGEKKCCKKGGDKKECSKGEKKCCKKTQQENKK